MKTSIVLRARVRRAIIAIAALAVGLSSALPAAATAAPGITSAGAAVDVPRDAREVRTVWTNEFGVDRPAGLAYDPTREEFLVADDRPGQTALLRLGPDEELLGSVTLPALDAPETLAFDAVRQQLVGVDDGEQVRTSASALDAARPTSQRVAVDAADLTAPDSTTFDPRTGTWYVLDDASDTIVVVPPDDRGQASSLPIAAGDDRVIAINPADGALYVLDDANGRIDRLDRHGSVRTSFDVAPSLLADPVAMTFAPTTDSTDEPGETNLFVADAGGARTLGGVVELSLAAVAATAAPTDTATLVRTTQTSSWSPASPDPSGVVWVPASDELVVVDSEVDEKTGAGWHKVNLWRSSRMGAVVGTGTMHGSGSAGSYSREPTGLGYDDSTGTLFVSDDDRGSIFAVRRGNDQRFGTADDAVSPISVVGYGGVDTEDPEFDPPSGDLFYLDGISREIYRITSVDGVFGNGNDTMTHFDISHLGPTDFEGLTSNPARGTLYVGARTTKQIFEITHDGTLIRTISATGISGLTLISGLAMAPASDGTGQMNLWIVDRAIDNGPNPNENDGRMFEIAAPNVGGAPANGAPVAVDDSASTTAGAVAVPVLANDSDPDGDQLTVTNLTQPADGSAATNADQTVTYTPPGGFTGTATFTYTASDGQATSNVATVTVTVTGGGGTPAPPALRSATSAAVTGASGTTLTIARPAGVQPGDLLLAQIRHRSTSTMTAPSGWTEVNTITQSVANHGVYYKVAGSSEPASYAFNQGNDAGRMAGGIGAYTGVDPTAPIDDWAASAANTATLVAPDATATVANTMVVRLWGWRGPSASDPGVGANSPPSGVTTRWSEQTGSSNTDRNRVLAGDHIGATAGAVGTATAAGSASTLENRRSAFTIILRPAN